MNVLQGDKDISQGYKQNKRYHGNSSLDILDNSTNPSSGLLLKSHRSKEYDIKPNENKSPAPKYAREGGNSPQ